jgi:Ca2+-transporting ATPase
MFSGDAESTIVILLVLVMNAVLGTIQHVKAQKSLDSLKQLSSPSAKVIRDGSKIEVPSISLYWKRGIWWLPMVGSCRTILCRSMKAL